MQHKRTSVPTTEPKSEAAVSPTEFHPILRRRAPRIDGRPSQGFGCRSGVRAAPRAQFAIDTTMVSPLHRDGMARRAADNNGAALEDELVGERGRARLVVLGAEVGGRWSGETAGFLSALSQAKAESAPEIVREEVRRAWLRRWRNLLSCTAARAFATSFLERRTSPGVTSAVPMEHEVLRESRFF